MRLLMGEQIATPKDLRVAAKALRISYGYNPEMGQEQPLCDRLEALADRLDAMEAVVAAADAWEDARDYDTFEDLERAVRAYRASP